MLLLKKPGLVIESSDTRVSAEDAAAVANAEAIVRAAEDASAEMAKAAQAAYEAERQRGYAEGIEEGKQQILQQKLELLNESIRYMESIELKVTNVVVKALKKCVAEIGDQELVAQIVHKSMQAVVRNQRQITVKVHPDMVATVKSRMDGILKDFPSVSFVDVVEDPHLAATACLVETEAGIVEASVDGQLAAIEKSLNKHFHRGEA